MGDSKWKDAGRGRQVSLRRPVSQGPSDCLKPGGLVTVFAGSKQCPLQFLHPCLQCVIFFYNLYFCRYYEEKPQEEFQEEPKRVQEESQSGSRGATASSRVFEILVHLIQFYFEIINSNCRALWAGLAQGGGVEGSNGAIFLGIEGPRRLLEAGEWQVVLGPHPWGHQSVAGWVLRKIPNRLRPDALIRFVNGRMDW